MSAAGLRIDASVIEAVHIDDGRPVWIMPPTLRLAASCGAHLKSESSSLLLYAEALTESMKSSERKSCTVSSSATSGVFSWRCGFWRPTCARARQQASTEAFDESQQGSVWC